MIIDIRVNAKCGFSSGKIWPAPAGFFEFTPY